MIQKFFLSRFCYLLKTIRNKCECNILSDFQFERKKPYIRFSLDKMMSLMNEEDKYLKQCRICLENDNKNDMISPCLCDGSLSCVHRTCLDYWRTENAHKKSSQYCEICKFKYVIENVVYDKIKLLKYYLLLIRDCILLILCFQPVIMFVAYLCKAYDENQNTDLNSISGFTGYYLTAYLILFGILGFAVVIIAIILSIFDINRAHPSFFTGNITAKDVLYACAFVGFLFTILLFVSFLKQIMEYHRNKIWLKQEPNNYIIKDFTGKRRDLQFYKTNQ